MRALFCILLIAAEMAFAISMNAQTLSATGTAPNIANPAAKAEMANRVRLEFLHAWSGYKQYAWGHDELKPLSKSFHDWYKKPLLITPVDALDTMLLMGLKEQANEDRELIATKLSFDQDIYVKNLRSLSACSGGCSAAINSAVTSDCWRWQKIWQIACCLRSILRLACLMCT